MREKFRGLLIVLIIAGAAASGLAAVQLSRAESDRAQEKFNAIAKNGAANPPRPLKTNVTEREANSYLAFELKPKMPKGLANPEVHLPDTGQVTARVLLDMDEFNRGRQSSGAMDPLSYLTGQVPVTARGSVRTSSGRGQIRLASAEIMGIPVPKPVVQEIVSYFTRTRENPAGFDIDKPFDLPAKIREIVIDRGEAVVVQ